MPTKVIRQGSVELTSLMMKEERKSRIGYLYNILLLVDLSTVNCQLYRLLEIYKFTSIVDLYCRL